MKMKLALLNIVCGFALGAFVGNALGVEADVAPTAEQQTEAEAVPAEEQHVGVAESGLGKIVWDIDLRTSPQQFNVFLKAIRKTYDDLVKAGITPDMVLVFRGLGASFSRQGSGSTWSPKIRKENIRLVDELQQLPGVRIEADQEAIRGVSDEARRLLPKVKAVENVFITLMSHQAEGYHVITID